MYIFMHFIHLEIIEFQLYRLALIMFITYYAMPEQYNLLFYAS